MNSHVFTLPNLLSFLRLVLSPFILILIKIDLKLCFLVFIILSISDGLDGIIARLTNSISVVGKILDPLADKSLIIFTSLAFMKTKYKISIILFKLIIAREVFIIIGSLVLLYNGVLPKPSISGKITTFFIMFMFYGLFIENIIDKNIYILDIMFDIAFILLVVSLLDYLSIGFKNISYKKTHKVLK